MAKRKADVASLNLPEVLEPTSAAQLRKAKRPESLSAPKALTFADQLEASAIAQLAAGECGFDEGEMAAMLMMRPVMAATHVFDFIQKPGYVQAEKEFNVLLQHFEFLFAALGGDASAVLGEWSSLCRMVAGDPVLRALPLTELYSRAFLHFQSSYFNVLLVAALSHAAAMDVVLSECGAPMLLPSLKRESVNYKSKMLLFVVGRALQKVRVQEVSMINVASLTHEWAEMSAHEP